MRSKVSFGVGMIIPRKTIFGLCSDNRTFLFLVSFVRAEHARFVIPTDVRSSSRSESGSVLSFPVSEVMWVTYLVLMVHAPRTKHDLVYSSSCSISRTSRASRYGSNLRFTSMGILI